MGLSDVFGKWPGDETDEELQAMLNEQKGVSLTLDEAKALRACAMGDAISTYHLNSALAKVDEAIDAARQPSEPNGVDEAGK